MVAACSYFSTRTIGYLICAHCTIARFVAYLPSVVSLLNAAGVTRLNSACVALAKSSMGLTMLSSKWTVGITT